MTNPTMSAEERATKVLSGKTVFYNDLVNQFRQAEQAAYERAARVSESYINVGDEYDDSQKHNIAKAIRAFTQEPEEWTFTNCTFLTSCDCVFNDTTGKMHHSCERHRQTEQAARLDEREKALEEAAQTADGMMDGEGAASAIRALAKQPEEVG